MFRCHQKKINYYLRRKLVTKIDDKVYQLTFTPAGVGWKGDWDYLQPRANVCVVCNSSGHLTRHHVVPRCYLKYLHETKSHAHYDILPLCELCHVAYEEHADALKAKLAEQYNAPADGVVDQDLKLKIKGHNQATGYIKTLKNHASKIPPDKISYLLNVIREEFKDCSITLQTLPDPKFSKLYKAKIATHAKLVIDQITDDVAFIKMWRNHFITTMNPQYLPQGWSIDRPPDRNR